MTGLPSAARTHFDANQADVYDDQFRGMGPLKDAAHLLFAVQFCGLPENARILMAGAGTRAEARCLARQFPGWRLTLVDPSAPMLVPARRLPLRFKRA